RFFEACIANVRMQRSMVGRGGTKSLQNLRMRGAWNVSDTDADRRRAAFKTLCNQIMDLRDLILRGGISNRIALRWTGWGPTTIAVFGSPHNDSSRTDVAHRSSIVDEPLAFLPGVPGIYVRGSALKVKRCRHSVHRVDAIVFEVLSVR